MINVNQITARLASMPDQALQQYAAMHKNDPYVMALALSESNRRKQMRQGAQMQTPQQPKVVDQEIAGMAQPMPEDVGIGQLPAPSMQSMAEGGIVAFANEGYVDPAFTYGIEAEYGGLSPLQQAPLTPAQLARAKLEKEREKNMAVVRAQGVNMRPTPAKDPRLLGATPPAETVGTLPAAPGLLPAAPPTVSNIKPPAPAPAAKPATGLPALNTKPMTAEEAAKQAAALGDDKEVRKELQGYVDRQKKVGEEAVGSFEKGIAGLPEAYKKYEARLQKEEAESATDKDKALGMSIFKAGLAMMSGTSQNAFENIGKGAMVGLEDQQAALKEFKKAQRERDKAFADIEQARLADQRGDLKTKLELESRAADRTAAAEGKMVDGIAELFKTNKANARGIYQTGIEQLNQNQRTIFEQGEATKRTAMQINAPTSEERVLSNPALFKKKMELLTAATGMRGDTTHRETWAKSPMLQAQYPKIEDYLRVMGLQPTVNLPANAPVRP
jgi:hypothetical protein